MEQSEPHKYNFICRITSSMQIDSANLNIINTEKIHTFFFYLKLNYYSSNFNMWQLYWKQSPSVILKMMVLLYFMVRRFPDNMPKSMKVTFICYDNNYD